jgi:hypothetical protein
MTRTFMMASIRAFFTGEGRRSTIDSGADSDPVTDRGILMPNHATYSAGRKTSVRSVAMAKPRTMKPGETTADGRFTLSLVECLGSCGTAPMFQINFDYHENLTPGRVDQILDSLP